MDAALTDKKQGAEEVKIVFLENRQQVPAFDIAQQEAEEENLTINIQYSPEKKTRLPNGKLIFILFDV